jgi:WD40 repeat protein
MNQEIWRFLVVPMVLLASILYHKKKQFTHWSVVVQWPRLHVATFAGAVKCFENGAEIGQLGSHAGAATSLAMHPSGQILASTGVDKSFIFYDLSNMKVASHIYTESGKYHHAIII